MLREKQTKQLERVTAKQESELRALADELRKETEGLDATFEEEEQPLRREFSERKNQLVARWTLAEAIERRRLEKTTGELYGPLPVIPWADRRSVTGTGEVEQADQGFAHEAVMAYEATTIPIIGVDV